MAKFSRSAASQKVLRTYTTVTSIREYYGHLVRPVSQEGPSRSRNPGLNLLYIEDAKVRETAAREAGAHAGVPNAGIVCAATGLNL